MAEPGERQADDLEAFDRETESLLSGADRVIQWYAALLPRLARRRHGIQCAAPTDLSTTETGEK